MNLGARANVSGLRASDNTLSPPDRHVSVGRLRHTHDHPAAACGLV